MRYYAHFGHKDFILCLGYGLHINNYCTGCTPPAPASTR